MEQSLVPNPIYLNRSYLNLAIAAPQSLGVAWGRWRGDDMIVVDEYDNGYRVVISASSLIEEACVMTVITQPRVNGYVRLTLGEYVFRARFGRDGKARLIAIPTALLVTYAGPDLQLHFELDMAAD